jgi:hypothetical protein
VQIVAGQITVAELSTMAEATFGDLVKAVADVRRGLLAVHRSSTSALAPVTMAGRSCSPACPRTWSPPAAP